MSEQPTTRNEVRCFAIIFRWPLDSREAVQAVEATCNRIHDAIWTCGVFQQFPGVRLGGHGAPVGGRGGNSTHQASIWEALAPPEMAADVSRFLRVWFRAHKAELPPFTIRRMAKGGQSL